MTFIVNPSPRLSVVRQIAAVKILFAVLAMIAGGLQARAQSDARVHNNNLNYGFNAISSDHSRIPAQRSHVLRQDVLSVSQELLSSLWPQNFAPRC